MHHPAQAATRLIVTNEMRESVSPPHALGNSLAPQFLQLQDCFCRSSTDLTVPVVDRKSGRERQGKPNTVVWPHNCSLAGLLAHLSLLSAGPHQTLTIEFQDGTDIRNQTSVTKFDLATEHCNSWSCLPSPVLLSLLDI